MLNRSEALEWPKYSGSDLSSDTSFLSLFWCMSLGTLKSACMGNKSSESKHIQKPRERKFQCRFTSVGTRSRLVGTVGVEMVRKGVKMCHGSRNLTRTCQTVAVSSGMEQIALQKKKERGSTYICNLTITDSSVLGLLRTYSHVMVAALYSTVRFNIPQILYISQNIVNIFLFSLSAFPFKPFCTAHVGQLS